MVGADDERDDRSAGLDRMGLRAGDKVRWRRKAGGHWHVGVVIGLEADGSVAVRDKQGRWRSIVAEQLEARGEGSRGGTRWESVSERAEQPAQLDLFG
ncbi:MAG TPA: hypothetical protein VGO78_16070 [Acidimicrobiales bacterium]|nr:hypothetical protein [Acidimicrobiales bacterium]